MAATVMQKLLHLKSWLRLTFENTSLVIQYTSLSVVVLYLIGLIHTVYKVLAVTPGFLIPPNFRIWTLITGGLIESNIVYVIVDVAVLLLCARQLEPLWGALELLKFLVILDVFTSILTVILCLLAYLSTNNLNIWFATFSGMAGLIGGIAVAFKQIMPDNKIDLRITEIRVEMIPSLLLFTSCIFSAVGMVPLTNPLQLFSGILVGWIYLRFYQPRGKGIKGDMNEHFEFAAFFPTPIRPPIRKISLIIFNILIKTGICKTPVRTYDVGALSAITISLPGMSPNDAERRRRKALRALNERLKREQSSHEDNNEESWPSIDDETTKKGTEASDVIVDIENASSSSNSDPDVEIIDKSEIEGQQL
eukprot:Seg1738.12 transcript_id=Seg1738.12/GoldUCD/mRNA.D3Y31 product="Transmembrane protein 115" protein_id=Seg1738.12/GoldUCD/D3Y31